MPTTPRDAAQPLPTANKQQKGIDDTNGNDNNSSRGNIDVNSGGGNSSIGSTNSNGVTKVFRGSDSVLEAILQMIENATKRYDSCVDPRMPAQVTRNDRMWKAMQGLHSRGIRQRAIVEITAENLPFVKEATRIMDLRHLGGIKGNFAVTDSEYMSTAFLALESQPGEPVPQLVYSNLEEIVEQQQYVFDILWNRAIPAEQRIREIEEGRRTERTEIISDDTAKRDLLARILQEAREEVMACVSPEWPASSVQHFKRYIQEAIARGVRYRYITEITDANRGYCKALLEAGVQLRHIQGIRGNFGIIDERLYIASADIPAWNGHGSTQSIYSNAEAMVQQSRFVFEMLWSRAVPGEQRIREVEEGLEPPYTVMLNSQEEIAKVISKSISESTGLAIYSDTGGMQMIHNHYFDHYREALARQKAGAHGGIRWLITVGQENKDIVKAFLDAGVQVRHTTYMSPMTFALDGRALYMTVDEVPDGRMIQSNFMITNEPSYLKHFSVLFEELWSDGTDAASKIAEIEEGRAADAEVIRNPARIGRLYKETIDRAEKEVMLIWTAPNAFARQSNLGVIDSLKRAAGRGARVRIMASEGNSRSVDARRQIQELVACGAQVQKLSQRQIEERKAGHAAAGEAGSKEEREVEGAHLNAAIVDGKVSWIVEIKDNSRHDFAEAVGTAVMSTGRSIVLSYVRIFEALWLEAELVARLRETDAMQKDFVNVAAHELRTPITSMLMAASNARPASEGAEEVAMTRMQYDIILRNTRRLAGLVNDILDASRIENGTFALRKEPVDLMALAREAVVEARSQEAGIGDDNDNDYNSGRAKVVILREDSDKSGSSDSSSRGPVVRADPDRIRQVFVNLLTNAAKFTDGEGVEGGNGGRGTITISIRAEGDQAIASVSDTGSGIDKDMLPRLFQKFAAKSFKGIGLGLYICRWIVELHGGRIWAQNNPGGKGATFTFTLPVSGGATAAATTTSTAAANTPPATTMDAAKQQQQQQ